MSQWKEYKLGEIINIIGGGTPKTSKPEYWNGEIPWLSVVDFGNDNKYVRTTEKTITEEGLKNSSTKILKQGQIIISARGTVGELAVLGNDMAFNQSCYGIDAFKEVCINDFLYYLLKVKINELKRNAHGAVFDTITRITFDTIKVSLPPLPTQTAIASILSSLDQKIELNNAINRNLEALAQALFKQWFVEFEFPNENGEPYKSSGGEMIESELGEIPKGWRVGKLGGFIKYIKGKKPKEVSNYRGEDLVPQILIDTLDGGKPFYTTPDKMVISDDTDILMVMDGASSGRVETGYFGAVGSTIAIIEVQVLPRSFMYFFLKSKENDIRENTTGAAIPHADKAKINDYDILQPKKDVLESYKLIADNILSKIKLNKEELKGLAKLRDTLLPKLISGELEVKDIDTVTV